MITESDTQKYGWQNMSNLPEKERIRLLDKYGVFCNSLEEAYALKGNEGFIATLPEILQLSRFQKELFSNEEFEAYFGSLEKDDSTSRYEKEFSVIPHGHIITGRDLEGIIYKKGTPIKVIIHGEGLLSPENLKKIKISDYINRVTRTRGIWTSNSIDVTTDEDMIRGTYLHTQEDLNNLLDGKLGSTNIAVYTNTRINQASNLTNSKRCINSILDKTTLPHSFAVVVPVVEQYLSVEWAADSSIIPYTYRESCDWVEIRETLSGKDDKAYDFLHQYSEINEDYKNRDMLLGLSGRQDRRHLLIRQNIINAGRYLSSPICRKVDGQISDNHPTGYDITQSFVMQYNLNNNGYYDTITLRILPQSNIKKTRFLVVPEYKNFPEEKIKRLESEIKTLESRMDRYRDRNIFERIFNADVK